MKERLTELRKTLGLSMDEFGSRIGVTKSTISRLEAGSNNFTDQMIKSISREYNVSNEWFEYGEGEMFRSIPEEDEIATYVSELLEDDGENPIYNLIKEIMHTYIPLDNKSKEVLNNYAKNLLNNLNAKKEG